MFSLLGPSICSRILDANGTIHESMHYIAKYFAFTSCNTHYVAIASFAVRVNRFTQSSEPIRLKHKLIYIFSWRVRASSVSVDSLTLYP